MYKQDLALSNPQWLICHKTKPNQTQEYTCEKFVEHYVGAIDAREVN